MRSNWRDQDRNQGQQDRHNAGERTSSRSYRGRDYDVFRGEDRENQSYGGQTYGGMNSQDFTESDDRERDSWQSDHFGSGQSRDEGYNTAYGSQDGRAWNQSSQHDQRRAGRRDRGWDPTEYRGGQDYGRGFNAPYSESQRSSYANPHGAGQMNRGHEGQGPKNYKRSDERIHEDLVEMLTRNFAIDATNIDVEVKEGVVTLTGDVPERQMKHLAEDSVERAFGVKDVVNNLRVKKAEEGLFANQGKMDSSSRVTDTHPGSAGTSGGSTGKKETKSGSSLQ